MPEPTIPRHAEKLIEAVSNRLHGIIDVLEMLREREDCRDADVLLILGDTVADQIKMLEDSILPIVQRGPALPLRMVPRG